MERKIKRVLHGNYYRDMYNKNFFVKMLVHIIIDKAQQIRRKK
jgi:hypothetical protein